MEILSINVACLHASNIIINIDLDITKYLGVCFFFDYPSDGLKSTKSTPLGKGYLHLTKTLHLEVPDLSNENSPRYLLCIGYAILPNYMGIIS